MLSSFNPLLRIMSRHAESTDTRQSLHKDDAKITPRKEDDSPHKKTDPSMWEDTTAVSISALRLFLEAILTATTKQAQQDRTITEAPQQLKTHQRPPAAQNTHTHKALNAYKTTVTTPHSSERTAPPPTNSDLTTDLKEDDIKRIQLFIDDLTTLENHGLRDIIIERGLTFLDSVDNAINAAKITHGLS